MKVTDESNGAGIFQEHLLGRQLACFETVSATTVLHLFLEHQLSSEEQACAVQKEELQATLKQPVIDVCDFCLCPSEFQ